MGFRRRKHKQSFKSLNKHTCDRAGRPEHLGDVPRHVESVTGVTSRPPTNSAWGPSLALTVKSQMFEMRSVPTDVGRGRMSGEQRRVIVAPVAPAKVKTRPHANLDSLPPWSPHLLPGQRRAPAPRHLGGEGGGPGRGVEVLRGDGQELGDTELLGHGWSRARVRGLRSGARGSLRALRCNALGRPHHPQWVQSGPPHAPPPGPPRPARTLSLMLHLSGERPALAPVSRAPS